MSDSRVLYELRQGRHFQATRWALAKRWFWIFVMRYDSEICHECGSRVGPRTGSWWSAPDDLWIEIVQPEHVEYGSERAIGSGCLCPPCFTKACERKGFFIYWQAVVERVDTTANCCSTGDCLNLATRVVSVEDQGYFPYCDACAEVLLLGGEHESAATASAPTHSAPDVREGPSETNRTHGERRDP